MQLLRKLMNTVALTSVLLGVGIGAQASSLIPTFTGKVIGGGVAGSTRWNYTVDLSSLSEVRADTDSFLTMYDFPGMIGADSTTLDWDATFAVTGRDAALQAVPDNALALNVSFTYIGPPATILGPVPGIFSFYIDSTISTNGVVNFAGQDTNSGTGTPEGNSGPVVGAAIPEPAFYQMSALLLLGGVGLLKRRKKA